MWAEFQASMVDYLAKRIYAIREEIESTQLLCYLKVAQYCQNLSYKVNKSVWELRKYEDIIEMNECNLPFIRG